MTRKQLEELYNIKKEQGAVAFAFGVLNNDIYYSINGPKDAKKREQNEVERILRCVSSGSNITYCETRYSFTILQHYAYVDIKKFESWFYGTIPSEKFLSVPFPLADKKIFLNDRVSHSDYLDPEKNRFFTCAEKKVIGYSLKEKEPMKILISSRAPCYHCLPVISEAVFLYKKRIHRIRKMCIMCKCMDETSILFYSEY